MRTTQSNYPVSCRYFVSSNGEGGFHGYFDRVFDPHRFARVYIIQGGPGTGKSSMMRRIAAAATERGARCEEILCSSDADSLDGIILEKNGRRIGVLDGTAPHIRIASLPGCREEILHFGAFWNSARLTEATERILLLDACKKEAFGRAYAILRAVGAAHRAAALALGRYFLSAKAAADASRKLQGVGKAGEVDRRFFRTYSMQGERRLPIPIPSGAVYPIVGDVYSAEYYLSILIGILRERHIAHTVYLSPLTTDTADGVQVADGPLFCKAELLGEEPPTRPIRTARFLEDGYRRAQKRQIHHLAGAEATLLAEALGALGEAAVNHFALERIYGAAMDFEGLRAHIDGRLPELLAPFL